MSDAWVEELTVTVLCAMHSRLGTQQFAVLSSLRSPRGTEPGRRATCVHAPRHCDMRSHARRAGLAAARPGRGNYSQGGGHGSRKDWRAAMAVHPGTVLCVGGCAMLERVWGLGCPVRRARIVLHSCRRHRHHVSANFAHELRSAAWARARSCRARSDRFLRTMVGERRPIAR